MLDGPHAGRVVGHEDHVADLTRGEVMPVEDLAVEDEPAADAGADPAAHQVRRALSRARLPLAVDRDVHVVVQGDLLAEPLTEDLGDLLVFPAEVHRLEHDPGVGVNRARRPHAHGLDRLERDTRRVAGFLHTVDDAVQHRVPALVGEGLPLRPA